MPKYVEPAMGQSSYTCPYCETLSSQYHLGVILDMRAENMKPEPDVKQTRCSSCNTRSWWIKNVLVYPHAPAAEPPQEGMPEDVLDLYREASAVAAISPRSAAALLRTALEVLTSNHLGQSGTRLNNAIGNLVKAGDIDPTLQKAMDVLRLTGNDAVHPSELRLDDSSKEAAAMFRILNLIVERTVVMRKQIDDLFDSLPEPKLKQIEQRDKPKETT